MLNKAILGSRPTFRITVSAGSGGTASVNKQYAAEGETVTISISPYSNYVISSVSVPGATVSGSGHTRTFKMPAQNVTVSVMFTYVAPTYSISLSAGTGGTASLSTYSATAGTRVYIYVSPSTGYEVASVSASGVSVSGSGTTYYFTMPSRSVSVSVSFVMYATHTIKIVPGGSDNIFAYAEFDNQYISGAKIDFMYCVNDPQNTGTSLSCPSLIDKKINVTRLDTGATVQLQTRYLFGHYLNHHNSELLWTLAEAGKTLRLNITIV
jgi:hypothetical protein